MTTVGDFFATLGRHVIFFRELCVTAWRAPFEGGEFLTQFTQIAWRSLSTTVVAGLFTGAVLALQFYLQLKDFGAEAALGGLNTSAILREVGPTLIAFMLAGKVGAYTSAELGTMRVTDQVDALRCLGIDPVAFLLVPRFLAVVVTAILLLSVGLVISVIGGIAAAWAAAGINPWQYLLMIPHFTSTSAVVLALSKSVVFGLVMGHLACANGYGTRGGAEGVGRAVRATAVQSMVAIVLCDFTISWILGTITQISERGI